MATSSLVTHCGARLVSREQLEEIEAPPATDTWFPVKHATVIDTVQGTLREAGFVVKRAQFAISRGNARLFSTLDLETPLGDGAALAVGVRNSLDKSLPLGFCAGSRVFCCDNLAFQSDLIVHRRHTRFGQERFREAIAQAVGRLDTFRTAESLRIRLLQQTAVADQAAESLLLRSFEQQIVSHRMLARVIKEWREPSFEAFRPRTLWSLLNAFTTVLGDLQQRNPQRFVSLSMRLSALLGGGTDEEAVPVPCA
jgi:hypothetical protein